MKFSQLAQYLERLEKTASRNEITRILADLFSKARTNEIDKVVYLVSGRLAPNYRGVVFNIAEKMMIRAIAKAFSKEAIEVAAMFKKAGDLGNVAQSLNKNTKKGNFEVNAVYQKLMLLANDSGEKSQERKVFEMAKLFSESDPLSCRYLARIPLNLLRLGFSDMTILDALSVMIKGDKSARKQIEAVFNVTVDIGKIAEAVKERGLAGLGSVRPEPGTPIRPSLAERLPTAEKILEKVPSTGSGLVAVEPKYDGFRVQAHIFESKNGKEVKLFSRNLENTTHMFPDLVDSLKKIKVRNAIFDGEAIGYDPKTDKFLPFQETVQRKRKHGIEQAAIDFPLKLFVFDILCLNGKSLLELPFSERRVILNKILAKPIGKVELTRQDIVDSPDDIRDLIKKYLQEGLEGALIKKIDAPYKAGARGYHWVKYKKTTEEGISDTIDCLVMGIYKGKGKRAGFGAGAFLVGVKDGENFKTVSKIGTGLTDEQWGELDRRIKNYELRIMSKNYIVDKNLGPDLWVKPFLVVEILADEITKSPIHSAGYALRFPRLIKFRDDKNPDQVTSISELKKLFEMQKLL